MKSKERYELDNYEKWIEDEIEKGNFVPIENFDEVKRALERAAKKKLKELEEKKLSTVTIEFSSPELKEKAIQLLKEHFGKNLKVMEA
ncbi:hypothetical protein SAMN06269117_11222 [Balnearium lithotrophicum]|uniref:Uncharacterized protein n=1 Tax=Balnearium lithotrophicum TaxID=223788 RepID=A0A521CED0_9BACT|nr:hypothetical protein [Balnearium lithotrophicum]SMO57735.1 hypothetical protein SAMN06269117_11222 [Balnearium lithotrophicum]